MLLVSVSAISDFLSEKIFRERKATLQLVMKGTLCLCNYLINRPAVFQLEVFVITKRQQLVLFLKDTLGTHLGEKMNTNNLIKKKHTALLHPDLKCCSLFFRDNFIHCNPQ